MTIMSNVNPIKRGVTQTSRKAEGKNAEKTACQPLDNKKIYYYQRHNFTNFVLGRLLYKLEMPTKMMRLKNQKVSEYRSINM